MKTCNALADAEKFLHMRIPLTRTMGVQVVPHDSGFALEAPVTANHNHLDTAFGGSINAVATLAGYTLLWLELRDTDAELVVRESSIRFLRPIRETIRAVCDPVADDELRGFKIRLAAAGKAQMPICVRVEEAGLLAAEFRGNFSALGAALAR